MKKIFYTTSTLSILFVLIGMALYRNMRDFIYLLVMGLMLIAVVSGVGYIIQKIDKK